MRKFAILFGVISALLAAVVVYAVDLPPASPFLPDSVEAYIAEDPENHCYNLGKKNGVQDLNRVQAGWGNSNHFSVSKNAWVVGGQNVGGQCEVPASVVDPQDIMDEFCGLIKNGTQSRVRTNVNNWGNASKYFVNGHKRGDLKISGLAVGGHCWLSGDKADYVLENFEIRNLRVVE